jgi:membrane fusion protein, multidrug efflux system
MKRFIISLIILSILAAAGYYFFNVWQTMQKMTQRGTPPPKNVTAVQAKQQEWYYQIETTGSISALQGAMISSEVSGRITAINFKDGTVTEKGAPLFQIYPDVLEAQLANAEAAASLANIDYQRSVELYKKNAVSKADLDTKSSQLAQKKAIVAEYQAQLRQYNIVAPFAGQLGLHLADIGSFVTVGQPLINLQQLDPVRIDFSVPETKLGKLGLGQAVELVASSSPNKTYTGTIYAADSVIDPDTRSLSLRAKVPSPDHRLLPGTFSTVTVFAGEKHPVITLPQTAVVYNPESNYVYKVEDGIAKKSDVVLGIRRGDEVEIVSGVAANDTIIATGQMTLFNNAPVNIVSGSEEQK